MQTEVEWLNDRIKLYKLMMKYPHWGNKKLAKAMGRDPKWVSKWRKRLRAAPEITLDTFKSRPRIPHHPPERFEPQVQQLIVDMRQQLSEHLFRPAGAKPILYYIHKYQQEHDFPYRLPRSCSAINRILREAGYIIAKVKPTHEPIDLPAPMEEWEIDFGEIFLIEEMAVFEFLLVVDRGTSRVVYVEGRLGYNAETALEAIHRLFERCGMPKRIRFDRDPRLWGSWSRDSFPSALVRFLRVLGVNDVICPPRRPDKKPFVERTIRTIKEEWFARHAPKTLAEAQEALSTFMPYYHERRPHQGRACGNRMPEEVFPLARLPQLPRPPERVDPDHWLQTIQSKLYRRKVTSDGTIHIDRHSYTIGREYKGQSVLAMVSRKEFIMICNNKAIKTLSIKGLYEREMALEEYLEHLKEEARRIEMHRVSLWMRRGEPR